MVWKNNNIVLNVFQQVSMYASTWYVPKRDDKEKDKVKDIKEVQETITNPTIIGTNYKNKLRQTYYRYREKMKKYTAVVVQLDEPTFVITSFRTQRLRIKPPYVYISSIAYGGKGGKKP